MRHGIVLCVALAGCVGLGSEAPSDEASAIELGGTYQLANRIDLASAGILPDLASSTLESLSKLEENPAGAIIEILQASNAPIVSTLLSALPDVVKQQFANFINDYVFAKVYQGVPVAKQLASVIDDIASLVTRFQLDTTLELAPPDAVGKTNAVHSIAGVTFTVADHSWAIAAPDVVADLTQGSCTATALHIVEQSPEVQNGLLDLHDHPFGLPIGSYVLRGIDALIQSKLGQPDLRAALGAALDCAGLAHTVATRCIGPVCVGHEAEIKSMCDAGLDAIVADVNIAIKQLDLEALHFQKGQALMWDAPIAGGALDGYIDRIDGGVWTLAINLTGAEKTTAATFSGVRLVPASQ